MYPQSHFLFAFLIAEIFVKLGLLNHKLAFITAVLAVLIDLDHYILFAVKYKSLNPKTFWNSHVIKKNKVERTPVHYTKGFVLALVVALVLFFVNFTALMVFMIAYFGHMILDHLPRTKRERLRIKVLGFVFVISIYEIIFDVVLVVAVFALLLFI